MTYHKTVCGAGLMVESNVLHSFEIATSVRVGKSGERFVTDGPFAETRVEVRPIQDFGPS